MQAKSVGVICSFNSCRQGAFGAVLQFQLVQARSVGVAFYARADQERCAMQFRLVQARSLDVAFYARADQKHCAMQFRLVQAMSFVSCSLGSCRPGALCPTV
ncbi:hypothetical protein ACFX2I_004514 [Malus domestica]